MSTRLALGAVGALAGLVAFAGRGSRSRDMSEGCNALLGILSRLRALRSHYQVAHWRAQGPAGYSDHLLFERLYGDGGAPDLGASIDALGEKIVGMWGRGAVDSVMIDRRALEFLDEAVMAAGGPYGEECPVKIGLRMEEGLQNAIGAAQSLMEYEGGQNIGIDDYLATLANERQTAQYLLRQRQAPAPGGSAARRPQAPQPPISRQLAQARLLERLPPHESLEYQGAFGRYHRFLFWDLRERRERTANVTAASDRPDHLTVRLD